MEIYINDVLTMKLTCTPQYLAELTAGRLLTERMISSAEDIREIYICEYGKRAKVFLSREAKSRGKDGFVTQIPSCCTDNRVLTDEFLLDGEIKPLAPAKWTPDQIYNYAGYYDEDSRFHKSVKSTHCAYLFKDNKCLFKAKDIGRHNALDKVIGYALINGVNLGECALLSSGRIPLDMIRKVIAAGVPVFMTTKTATKEAAIMADHYNVALFGKVEKDRFMVYRKGVKV